MRFIEANPEAIGEKSEREYKWWFDTDRVLPVNEQTVGQKFVAVQTPADKNPNEYVRHDKLFNLFNDQAEYYHVCEFCYSAYRHHQWSGSTRMSNWRERSEKDLQHHIENKGWCEFCDPVFGNGGWV